MARFFSEHRPIEVPSRNSIAENKNINLRESPLLLVGFKKNVG